MNEEINGNFKEFTQLVKDRHANLFSELKYSLFDFYKPDAIKRRQKENQEIGQENLYWSKGAQVIPAGYAVSEAGALQRTDKVGRNDPCPCGSGKKFKKCCGQ